jgi:phytoene/squalene synthetase
MDTMVDTFEPTVAQQTYLEQKLGDVSRSFALVVPFLEAPLQHYLATAYLLCRVLDNIEDCGQSAEWKKSVLRNFHGFARATPCDRVPLGLGTQYGPL